MESVEHDFSTLEVITLNLPTGFMNELDINIYLLKTPQLNILIDTTTHYQNHAQLLQDLLTQHGVQDLHYLLLTHCHSDHAGNAQWIKKWFPQVQIVAHPVAAERLRKGSWMKDFEASGKEFFRRFGHPRPAGEPLFKAYAERKERPVTLPQEVDVLLSNEGSWRGIDIYFTPGHSLDHVCYGLGEHFFGGDTVLDFIPGMEEIWCGHDESFKEFVFSAQKLAQAHHKYKFIHTFHGAGVESLGQWYHQMIQPRVVKKLHKLWQQLHPDQAKTLKQLMQEMHPQYLEHYIYLSQYMGILYWMVSEGAATVQVDDLGAWHFRRSEKPLLFT